MQETAIQCPTCGEVIRLDETLAGPLVAETRKAFEAQLAAMATAIHEREAEAARQMIAAEALRADTEENLRQRLAAARLDIVTQEARKAKEAMATEVAELRAQTEAQTAKLAEAQKAQADFLRKEREIADRLRELDLTVEQRVSDAAATIRDKARAEADAAQSLKLAERDKVIDDMKRQMEEMKRRAEQGSQQLQGEVLELRLESVLQARFPTDRIEPVAKGVAGADIAQHVLTPNGTDCGTILWEVKRTKSWAVAWLAKLRDDQRATRADIAVLLSEALPQGIDTFGLIDGIWVAHPRYAEPLATMIRQTLVEMQGVRIAQAGQATKTEMVYAYLTGPVFRQRIEAVVERFSEMEADLSRERKAMQKSWARREQQIGAVIGATVGLYGDLQGIAGAAIPDIPALELPDHSGDATADPD